MSELNKCGCGGEAKSITHDESFISYVRCTNCGTEGPRLPTKEQAIKLWNTCFPTPVSKEDLAEYCHDEQWSGWMKYLFEKTIEITGGHIVIPKWAVERWTRQMNTKYKDLPDEEKESDIKEAEAIINKYSVHERNEKEAV